MALLYRPWNSYKKKQQKRAQQVSSQIEQIKNTEKVPS